MMKKTMGEVLLKLTNLLKWPMKTDVNRKPESVGKVKLNHKQECQQLNHHLY